MCQECGCGIVGDVTIDGKTIRRDASHDHEHSPEYAHGHERDHDHAHDHPHEHPHSHPHPHEPRVVTVEQGILEKNDRLAERNRGYFQAKGLYVLNILASPGAGKTAFIERMVADLRERVKAGVIVGDLATDHDAKRLRGRGVPAVQVTTGTTCHLDAEMVALAMRQLDLDALNLLVIENVGNLVCPAAYDLGEDLRVVLLSVTEGEDKPLKYPIIFKSAQVVVVNKMDIADAVGFDRETTLRNIHRMAPQAIIFETSARTGQGMDAWYRYLDEAIRGHAASTAST